MTWSNATHHAGCSRSRGVRDFDRFLCKTALFISVCQLCFSFALASDHLSSRCWWVDSSAPFFHPMSRVCGHRSADTAGHQRVPLPGEPINILQLEHQTQNHSKSKNQTPNLTFSITNASNSIRLSHAVGECVFAYTLAYTVCKGQGRQRGFTTSLVSSAEQHVWLIMIRSLSKEQNELKVDCR